MYPFLKPFTVILIYTISVFICKESIDFIIDDPISSTVNRNVQPACKRRHPNPVHLILGSRHLSIFQNNATRNRDFLHQHGNNISHQL